MISDILPWRCLLLVLYSSLRVVLCMLVVVEAHVGLSILQLLLLLLWHDLQ